MARARNIKPGFFESEQVGTVSPGARLLFLAMWQLADREGRMEDRPLQMRAYAFRYDSFTTTEIDGWLGELDTAKLIERYEVDGQKLLQIPTFTKHQRPHPKEPQSVLPAPKTVEPGKGLPFGSWKGVEPCNYTAQSNLGLPFRSWNGGEPGKGQPFASWKGGEPVLNIECGILNVESGEPAVQPRLALSLEVDPQQELRKLAEHLVQLLPAGGDTQLTAKALEYEFGHSASFDGDVIRFVASVRDKAAKWREAWDTNPDLKRQRAEYWVKDATYTRSPPQKAAAAQSFGRREHIPQVAPRDKGRICPRCEGLRTIFNGVLDESLTLKEIDALTVPCPECAV